MPHKCVAVGCRTGNIGADSRPCFHFPFSYPDLLPYWTKFINRPGWSPDPSKTHQVVCSGHFESKYLIRGKKRVHLDFTLSPIPTIQKGEALEKPSCLPTLSVPRKEPTKRVYQSDQKVEFKSTDTVSCFEDLTEDCAPEGFQFSRGNDFVIYYKLKFDEDTGFPKVFESIRVDKDLHVQLQFNGNPVPLPKMFTVGTDTKLKSFGALPNFASYLCNANDDDPYPFLEE